MEYKLNKVDFEIRQRINDSVKEGKIHSKNQLNINKYAHNENKEDKYESSNTNKHKKKVLVEAVKRYKGNSIEISVFKNTIEKKDYTGTFLDIKR